MQGIWLLSCSFLAALSWGPVEAQQDDAWLAVINGESQPQQPQPIQQPPQQRQPPYPQRPQQPVGERRREEGYNGQNALIRPAPVNQRLPPQKPARPGPPPPRVRPPPPPPGRRQPPPPPKEGGIGGVLTGIVGDVGCAAQNLFAEPKLKDPKFINYQLQCLLDKGECDEIGNLVKRMAPDIIRGGCPRPCDECKKKQIQKVMATLSTKYPKQFQIMLQKFGNRRF